MISKKLRNTTIAFFITLAAACSDNSDQSVVIVDGEVRPALTLEATESPIDITGINARFIADLRYGDGERNLLDIYLPDSDEPTPLVIYFHGGAYIGGDKSDAYDIHVSDIQEILQAGVAFATISYHLLDSEPPYDDDGVIRPLEESARALQFLRYHFKSLNLDPEQVASYGVSAGASTSLWLGTHDDLADPGNADPVLRESSRVKAVAALYTQSTLNFPAWESVLEPIIAPLEPLFGGTDFLSVVNSLGAGFLLFTNTGTDSVEEVLAPEKQPYLDNIDMLANMDAGDAPIYAYNDSTIFAGQLVNLFLHHALHVIALHDRANEVGLHNVMYAIDPEYALADPSDERHVSFLLRHIR